MSQEVKSKAKSYNTFLNQNKEVYKWGFKYRQLFIIGFSFLISIPISVLTKQYYICLLIIPVIKFFARVKKENSQGNPNYIQSIFVYRQSPKYLIDNSNLLKSL